MERKLGQTEKFMNFLMEELSISDRENILLKAKGQFNCQQANNTMKRFAERIGSYVIKNIIRDTTHLAEDLRDSEKGRNMKVASQATLSSPPGETSKSQKANSEVKG